MNHTKFSVSVAILAGGKSRRFGKDKGLTIFRKKPLIQHVIDIANKISNDVFIITNNADYQHLRIDIHNDYFNSAGPLAGLHSALKNCQYKHCFLLACDMPFLKVELLREMTRWSDHDAVVPVHRNMAEPLVGLYRKSALPLIEKQLQTGKFKMTDAIELLDHRWLEVDENSEFYDSKLFANINTREEWEQLQ